MLKPLDVIAVVLVVVGALNWALVGLFEFDLVATVTGDSFGEVNFLSRVVYILVGVSGAWVLATMMRLMGSRETTTRSHA
jgi:hypothetical protein